MMPGILKSKYLSSKQKSYDSVHYLCTVKFLDNSDGVTVTYQRSTKGRFLIDHVCSSIDLIEKDFFGLKYTDVEKQECWLDPLKTIHSQLKGISNPLLYFQVKYYPGDLSVVREEITKYQLFLQVRKDFNEGRLICSLEDALVLSAYVVQEEIGDYDKHSNQEDYTVQVKLPLSLAGYKEDIAKIHKQLKGLDQASAEYKFLKKAASLVSYGIDPYVVSDIKGDNMYLTVAPQGVVIFQDNLATNTYHWHEIRKLSFDGKMFYIRLQGKISGHKALKSHLNRSFFACTSANKPQQQTTIGYKCISHSACKQLWKNAVARKYFYTLHSSDEAPRVVSSGGLFSRSSKFRYSGNCLAEVCKSSANINREAPKFTRYLSHIGGNKDNRSSTLPHGWRPQDLREGPPVVTHHSSEVKVNDKVDEVVEVVDAKRDIRRSSSDSALEMTPAPDDSKVSYLLPSTKDTKFRHVDGAGAAECDFDASFISGDSDAHNEGFTSKLVRYFSGSDANSSQDSTIVWNGSITGCSEKIILGPGDNKLTNTIDNKLTNTIDNKGELRFTTETIAETWTTPSHVETFTCTFPSIDKDTHVNSTTSTVITCNNIGKLLTGVSQFKKTIDSHVETATAVAENKSDETDLNQKRKDDVDNSVEYRSEDGENGMKRVRQESGSGYDTGYISSGSERLSKSYEYDENNDADATRSNGILEEMEFPTSDYSQIPKKNETESISSNDFNSTDHKEKLERERVPSMFERDELLNLLSYGSDKVTNENTSNNGGLKERGACPLQDCSENEDKTDNNNDDDDDASPSSSSSSSNIRDITSATGNPHHPPTSPEQTTPSLSSLTGVLSSDNFKRMKEIERMIQENKSKIQLIKETMSSEIKKSTQSATERPMEIIDARQDILGEAASYISDTITNKSFFKQPKHVSFSTRHVEWYGENGQFSGAIGFYTGTGSMSNNASIYSQSTDGSGGSGISSSFNSPVSSTGGIGSHLQGHPKDGVSDVVEKSSLDCHFVCGVESYKCHDEGTCKDHHGDDKNGRDAFIFGVEDVPSRGNVGACQEGGSNFQQYIVTETVAEERVHTLTFPAPTSQQNDFDGKHPFHCSSEVSASSSLPQAPSSSSSTSSSSSAAVSSFLMPLSTFLASDSFVSRAKGDSEDTPDEMKLSETISERIFASSERRVGHSTDRENRNLESGTGQTEENVDKQPDENLVESEHPTMLRKICTGAALTALSATCSILVFVVFLIIIFEMEQDVPYITDQQAIVQLKRSAYEPVKEYVMSVFKQ